MAEKRKRKRSLSFFTPGLSSSSTFLSDGASSPGSPPSMRKKAHRNSTLLGAREPGSPRVSAALLRPRTASSDTAVAAAAGTAHSAVPNGSRPRRNTLQKSKRSSMLGSLRTSLSMEDGDPGHQSNSPSLDEDESMAPGLSALRNMLGSIVLHYGEVQSTGSMWRKRTHYLVLTDTYLIRFKSQSKAAEVFPNIIAPPGKTASVNRQSIASVASLYDQTGAFSSGEAAGIALNSIVSVCTFEDGRGTYYIEISYLDERTSKPAFLAIQLTDPDDKQLWLVGIRSAAQSARSMDPPRSDQRTLDYIIRVLENDRDYDPELFHLFRATQRYLKQPGRASSEEAAKPGPTICYVALGRHKMHLIPLPKASNRASVVSLGELETGLSFGFMALTEMYMSPYDDNLQLTFRIPLQSPSIINLASVQAAGIVLWVKQRTEFLRPLWTRQPYEFLAPSNVIDDSLVPPTDPNGEDFGCFDRTLIAYAASYGIDASNIRYSVDFECDDAPCFKLQPPASEHRETYTPLELLALMRALRYNESFVTISFEGINLDALQSCRDLYGFDMDAYTTRAGVPVDISGQDQLTVLSQEIRALAMKSRKLRKMDFSYCLSRIPVSSNDMRDPGCGIPEALYPLCRRQLTTVDWIVLNGIKLDESDLDYMVDAASQKLSRLRALEVGNCNISVHDLDLVLSTFSAQETTLEAVDISGVQGRLNPTVFQQHIDYFGRIRKLNLSRVARTSGPEPLIAAETLLHWRLEELSLSQTVVNEQTVEAIAAYLASDKSTSLRILRMDQCGLTGRDVATFLRCMSLPDGKPRSLHLHVSENNLDTDYDDLFKAIAENHAPTHLSMRMIDFKKEEHFRELIQALRVNTTLKYLDISKASLPYDAGPETCEALQLMFEENETLEELDISGEYAHLDVTRFGIGLNQALTGLKKNKSLKVLRIEHQKLGLQGANTLAEVLEANQCLREIHCEHNDINLQSFSVLINGLRQNQSVLFLPSMDSDRRQALEKVRREFGSKKNNAGPVHHPLPGTGSLRRSIHAAINTVGQRSVSHKLVNHRVSNSSLRKRSASGSSSIPASPQESLLESTLRSLNEQWDNEVTRLRELLYRNYCLQNNIPVEPELGAVKPSDPYASFDRPMTSDTLAGLVDGVQNLDLSFTLDDTLYRDKEFTTAVDSNFSSPAVTMYSARSQAAESVKGDDGSLKSQSVSPNPGVFNTEPKGYAASPNSSPQLALPVPAMSAPARIPGSIHSNCSSNLSSNTGTEASSAQSASGLGRSSLRKLLGNRAGGLRGTQQADALSSDKSSMSSRPVSDEPPRIMWSPPQIDL